MIRPVDSMDNVQNMEVLREDNEKVTKKNAEQPDAPHKKCGCYIF